jgi:hypothetical protein
MPPRLLNATLDESALRACLSRFSADLTTIYLESETRVVLAPLPDFLGPRVTLPPVRWYVGRAFGPSLEIRWNLQGDQGDHFEAIALTESASGPSDWQPSAWNPLLDAETRSRTVLLRGVNTGALPPDHVLFDRQSQGGLWIESSIPHPLTYPAPEPKAERVALRCVDYLSRGYVVITRMAALDTYQGQ